MSGENDREKMKREIFESMSARRRQKILKKGYDKWDPFLAPKEPPFFRDDERNRQRDAGEMFRQFLQEKKLESAAEEPLSLEYVEGAREICSGLVRDRSDRAMGIMDFCLWFRKQENLEP